MCLAQGHNAVMPLRLEPASSRSRVKHSTTEPQPSLFHTVKLQRWVGTICFTEIESIWPCLKKNLVCRFLLEVFKGGLEGSIFLLKYRE